MWEALMIAMAAELNFSRAVWFSRISCKIRVDRVVVAILKDYTS